MLNNKMEFFFGNEVKNEFSFQDYLELGRGAESLLCSTEKPFEIVFDSEGLPEKEEEEKEKPTETEEKVRPKLLRKLF